MTDIEITPDEYRAAARVLRESKSFTAENGNYAGEARWLETEADRLEAEQAAEKHIDELARISFDAQRELIQHEHGSCGMDWDEVDEFQRNVSRAGVRALVAHLADEVVNAEVYGIRDNGDVLLNASDAASVKAVLRFVFGRNNGEQYPTDDIENLKSYFWPELTFDKGGLQVKLVRQWGYLRDVPEDVEYVNDRDGEEYARSATAKNGWAWKSTGYELLHGLDMYSSSAPFTEILGGAQ